MRHRHRLPLVAARIGTILLLTVVAVVGTPWSPVPRVRANVGDLRLSVTLPTAAECSGSQEIGTSVALVPGSMLNRNQYPILLVTSCFDQQTSSLRFLDPTTSPATLVTTITTSPTPPQGWGALALRGDKGDLLGCGNDSSAAHTHGIYTIDISPFNSTADGTATLLFNGASGNDICDGLAWDTGDNTIFQSPDVSPTIYHYDATGTLLGSFASPSGCPHNSGLAVGGASLFASCNGDLIIFQVNKSTGATFSSFTTSAGTRTEDLECDPVSLGTSNVDLMWSKDAYSNQIFAFEIPQGTCGFAGGPPIVPPTCTDTDGNGVADNDGDALCDNWETAGIDANADGTVDLQLYDVNGDGTIQAAEDADPNHKDMYVEVDWMELHQPNNDALNDVIASFANAPVTNPDGTLGVRLHIQVNEQAVAHNTSLAFEPCTGAATGTTPDFDTVKNAMFGTAAERTAGVNVTNGKRFAFHYSLFVHNLLGLGGTSGCAELPGNDHVVSLGNWAVVGGHGVGSRDQQAGTFMHEFGHNLNLRHGGVDDINCKPNYLSVMSYSRQINNAPIPGRPLNYSPAALMSLNEASLSEPAGIGGPAGDQTAFGPPPVQVVASNGAINWNQDADNTDTGIAVDINNVPGGGCTGAGTVLQPANDWANLKYDFQNTTDFADGVHLSLPEVDEITIDEAKVLSPDRDGDGVDDVLDNCAWVANADQADGNGDGVGDVCVAALYSFTGFFQPVDNPGPQNTVFNSVKAGSAIPVKFSLNGAQGLAIFATNYPRSEVVRCDAAATVDGIEETVSAGGSSLRYDANTDQYIYTWKTDKAWAATCRQLVLRFNDGAQSSPTTVRANFKFVK